MADLHGIIGEFLEGNIKTLGGDANIEPKTITENGTYTAPEGVDGYSPVTVDVPQYVPLLEDKYIDENGLYSPSEGYDGIRSVNVAVPIPAIVPVTITENGTYTAPSGKAYSPVSVNVPLPENAYLLKSVNTPTPIASFIDGEEMVMPSLKVAIEPQQEGSGDPSPTNIRPISGWSNCVISVANAITDPTVEHTYNIDLDGTRYGGELDVVSGVMTVDRVSITVDENSNIISGSGGLPFRIDLLAGAKASSSASALTGVKCNFLKEVKQSSSWGVDDTFSRVTTDAKIVYFKVDSEITTIQQLKTFLQSNNLQFVYELDTPLTIQLTPTAVKSLLGTNNIWADTGDIKDAEYFSKEV